MAWSVNATLVIVDRESLLPGPALVDFIERHGVDAITMPPTVLAMLPADRCQCVRLVNVAGEACPPQLVECWARDRRFFNLYGPTEGTIWATAKACAPGARVTIGQPIGGVQAYVLDQRGQLAGIGAPGELCLGGAGVARGYVNAHDLTATKFIPDPFSPGGHLYRTGDRARWLADGELEYLGRADDVAAGQVKLRGFRIEIGEIEAAIGARVDIATCAVVIRSQQQGGDRLVAYVVPRAPFSEGAYDLAGSITRELRERLPEHMVPSVIVSLERLPTTISGKLDRAALPDPGATTTSTAWYVAPDTELERIVADVWRDVLRVERVGAMDGFFDLGGHSLLVVAAQAKLSAAIGRAVPVVNFFRHRTLRDFARSLADVRVSATDSVHVQVPRVLESAPMPATEARARAARQLAARHQREGYRG